MPRSTPLGLRRKTAKGKTYYYFDTGQRDDTGKPILKRLPDVRDPMFGRMLAAAQASRTKRAQPDPTALTLSALADLFEKSQEFRGLADATRNSYRLYLERARKRIGSAPANELSPADMAQIRDEMADTPGAANQLLRVVGALYKWGRKRRKVTAKPVEDVDYLEQGEHQPWPVGLLSLALEDEAVQLPVAMLYYTAQRIGDVCKMQWADLQDGAITLRQQKTGKDLTIPLHGELRRILARHSKRGLFILSQENSRPWKPGSLREKLQAWAEEHGCKIVPHGLRKNAVNALLEAGCSVAETAAISGQTLQVVEYYAKQRNQVHLGQSAILKWNKQGEGKQK